MSSLDTAIKLLITNKRVFFKAVFDKLNYLGLLHWVGDASFIKMAYWLKFSEKLDLNNPKTFNAKLQWLKLYDHRSEYITMVDKIAVKDYVAERVGSDYIIPNLGVWGKPEDIDWDSLPNQFVIKWNHDSGSIVICKDKNNFDKDGAIKRLSRGEKVNGFWYGREWPYKNVKPLLLAEPYLEDGKTSELRDYKVFCFDGKAKLLLVASERQKKGESVKFDFFDVNGKHLDIVNDHPQASTPPDLPSTFKTMLLLAEKISTGYPHLRVDFYEVDGKVYIGELTLYHGSGLMLFEPKIWQKKMGEWIVLPNINKDEKK